MKALRREIISKRCGVTTCHKISIFSNTTLRASNLARIYELHELLSSVDKHPAFRPSGAHPRGGGATGLQPFQNQNLKNTHFVDIMISKVLRDLPFSRNQPLKSADEQYIRIMKNKLIKFKKTRR
jgi:hypothetical protein